MLLLTTGPPHTELSLLTNQSKALISGTCRNCTRHKRRSHNRAACVYMEFSNIILFLYKKVTPVSRDHFIIIFSAPSCCTQLKFAVIIIHFTSQFYSFMRALLKHLGQGCQSGVFCDKLCALFEWFLTTLC